MIHTDILQQRTIDQVKTIVSEVATYIHKEIGRVTDDDIEEKELNSLVSYVDKTAEEKLVTALGTLIPGSGFITEEDTEDQPDKSWTWIIDPLDGTTNFLHQIPHFCVSVALQHEDRTVMGIVHEVNSNEQYFAALGGGAFLNGNIIRVSQRKHLQDILMATGFPYNNHYNQEALVGLLKTFLLRTRGIRRLGSAALDLCYVACGRLGAYYETSLNSWDLAAGSLIVEEAGGKVTDFQGNGTYLSSGEILACPKHFYSEILEIIQSHRISSK